MSDEHSPLRQFRKAHNLTLEDLAPKVGVSVGQLSRIEREGTTSLPTAMRLAEVTALPIECFARGEAA